MTAEFFEDPLTTRRAMAGDLHRPLFHFLPPRNWMNDPNGLFFHHGKYHLFYQYNPFGSLWGFIHWGHASGADLIRWEDHPIALAPEEGEGDDLGSFSGCLVDDAGIPTALYTGFVSFVEAPVLMARAQDPDLICWEKSPHNPVIAERPEGVNETEFRDPYVWREGAGWKMVIGAGMKDGESAALLYESPDLLTWHYQGHLFHEQTLETVTMWECPNFFPLEDQYVLLVSLFPNTQGVYYYVGDYDGTRFTPKTQGILEEGPIFYAPQVRQLKDDRTILFAWLLEGRSDEALEAAGWAGVQGLPRELKLDQAGHLISRPVDEVRSLRQEHHQFAYVSLDPGEKLELPVGGRQIEIELEIEPSNGGVCLSVLAAVDESELTQVGVNFNKAEGWLDTTKSSLSAEVITQRQVVGLCCDPEETIKMHVWVDGSVVEVWFNDSQSLTGRVYPTGEDTTRLFLSATGSAARIKSVSVWELAAIWPVST